MARPMIPSVLKHKEINFPCRSMMLGVHLHLIKPISAISGIWAPYTDADRTVPYRYGRSGSPYGTVTVPYRTSVSVPLRIRCRALFVVSYLRELSALFQTTTVRRLRRLLQIAVAADA